MESSPQLLDGVAATTQHRDREEIEQSLVQLLLHFLEADSVALFKLLKTGGPDRAVPCIMAETTANGDVRITLANERAFTLSDHPVWRTCIDQRVLQVTRSATGFESVFPVRGDGNEIPGLLQVLSQRAPDERELQLVTGILKIIRNHLALIDYGERDTLTGLLNRKTLESQFSKLRGTADPQSSADPSRGNWIALIDIDHFKSINDQYGHVFGDEVLLLVSQIIQRTFRGADRVYRFGGEEFVILLQDTPEQATAKALERLRAAVDSHPFPQLESVTVSIGWTRIRPQDAPANSIERADTALYHAKNHGRNRVCHYDSLRAAGELATAVPENSRDIELF